jgi:hypothetical protein
VRRTPAETAEAHRQWQINHREECQWFAKRWRLKNPDKVNEQARLARRRKVRVLGQA